MAITLEKNTRASGPGSEELPARLRLAITRTARRLRQEADAGLSPSLSAALATIERCGPVSPSRLAELERIQRPTATRLLARLEERELVTRAADPEDGRSSHVAIAPEGRALLKKLRSRKNAYLARRIKRLEEDDLRTLDRAADILERLLEEDA
ncbi:MAG: MarR family winged helix-turn-helix transcriptional regulator [Thermoleophilaceae bacterium]